MHRSHRLVPFAPAFLLVILVVLFALGSTSQATAEGGETEVAPAASPVTPVVSTDPDVVRELVEKRTENSRTFLLADGRLKSEVFEGAINFKDASGAWCEINPNLVTAAKGEYVSAATPVKVILTSPRSSTDLVTLAAEGATVGMRMEGTNLAAPVISDNKALYLSTTSNLVLAYEVLGNGLKETIMLLSAKAPDSYTFTINHPGLTMWQDKAGQWGLYEMVEYPPVLVMGGLTVFDSSLDAIGDPAFCADATMEVTPGEGKSTVSITVPKKWLRDPARKFPVMIDPTLYAANLAD
jgi:hypothetical protein